MNSMLIRKFLRFTIVGATNALVYAVATRLYAHVWSLDVSIASGLGYATAVPMAFLGHRNLTFEAGGALSPQFVRFVVSHLFGLMLSVAIAWVTSDLLGWHIWIGIGVTTLTISIMSYVIMNRWVFASS